MVSSFHYWLSIVDCGELVPPSNGMVSYTSGTLLGSMATYMCDAGYDLVGGDTLHTCGSDGNWSGMEPPNCLRKLKVSPLHK